MISGHFNAITELPNKKKSNQRFPIYFGQFVNNKNTKIYIQQPLLKIIFCLGQDKKTQLYLRHAMEKYYYLKKGKKIISQNLGQ